MKSLGYVPRDDSKFYLLTGGDGGNIPPDYPLRPGDICRPVNGRLPENAWNQAEKAWVALVWESTNDPSSAAVTP